MPVKFFSCSTECTLLKGTFGVSYL
jgi:hypothetical protein